MDNPFHFFPLQVVQSQYSIDKNLVVMTRRHLLAPFSISDITAEWRSAKRSEERNTKTIYFPSSIFLSPLPLYTAVAMWGGWSIGGRGTGEAVD